MSEEDKKLFANKFIRDQEFVDLPDEKKKDFRQFHEQKQKDFFRKRLVENLDEDVEINDLLNTNAFKDANPELSLAPPQMTQKQFMPFDMMGIGNGGPDQIESEKNPFIEDLLARVKRERRTIINIDSKNRNAEVFPSANRFVVSLDRIYENVKSVRLITTEFPNTNQVIIGSSCPTIQNNQISWINEEDSPTFVTYTATITPGVYTAISLANEMVRKMNCIERTAGFTTPATNQQFHEFTVNINLDTDIVKITQFDMFNVVITSTISTVKDDDQFTVTMDLTALGKGITQDIFGTPLVAVGDEILVSGLRTSAGGLSAVVINGLKTVTAVADPTISFRVKGGFLASAGVTVNSDSLRIGFKLPFKLLFGSGTAQVAGVLGFAIEDSAEDVAGTNQITTNNVIISDVTVGSPTIITSTAHGFVTGEQVKIFGLTTIPSLTTGGQDSVFTVTLIDPNNFSIPFATTAVGTPSILNATVGSNRINVNFTAHDLAAPDQIRLYRSTSVGGIPALSINNQLFTVIDIDANNFQCITGSYATLTETGGGTALHISSNDVLGGGTIGYGFRGTQDNTSDGTLLNRNISLDGENYVLLTSPQLGSLRGPDNADEINNIVFAKILLSAAPGTVLFNTFLSNAKFFDEAEAIIERLEFTLRRPDGELYQFNNLNYSFSLEIIEFVDELKATQFSSRSGIRRLVDDKFSA